MQLVSGRQDRWRRRVGVGVKVSYPLDTYLRLGARRTYLYDYWSLNLDESYYWFDHKGQSFITSVEFNRQLADKLLFRSSSRARWAEVNGYVETSQVFSFFQSLDKIRLVTFQAGVYGVTEPAIMATDYRVSASIRQNLRKQYLFVELIPQLRYQKIHAFVPERGIVLRLEWVFQG